MSAASPGIISMYMDNHYYESIEDYTFAIAAAMKEEYDAIYQAGVILQIDCPDVPCGFESGTSIADFRRRVAMRLEALDLATRDIPPDRMRMHLCWGNSESPHTTDVPLAEFIDLVLAARPGGILLEGANPRHEHEWAVFEDTKLPDGKVVIPGVLDSTTNFVEHPELVAQRLIRYADVVGRSSVIAGSDCGFATIAGMSCRRSHYLGQAGRHGRGRPASPATGSGSKVNHVLGIHPDRLLCGHFLRLASFSGLLDTA